MWLGAAFLSAVFAGITSILAKVGIKNVDSDLATAIRVIVVLVFSWIMIFLTDVTKIITLLSNKSLIFIVLSGLATGVSWICYFKALQLGDVNKVVPIDKSSTVLTMILAFIFLNEKINLMIFISMIMIGIGTLMMIQKQDTLVNDEKNKWLLYAVLSAVFASLTTILAKIGVDANIDSNLATGIRTIVVVIFAWGIVFYKKKQVQIKNIDKKSWLFLIFSGFATGFSWLFYYYALQYGEASVIVPIDKLSIVVTVLFAYYWFKETLTKKQFFGFVSIIVGTLLLTFFK